MLKKIDPGTLSWNTLVRMGIKVTPQRMVICAELLKARDHPTAETIFQRVRKILPRISFDTVYRTLQLFTRAGLVNLVEGYGENRRFEPDKTPHHHCWCLECRTIFDFTSPAFDAMELPAEITEKFRVTGRRLIVEGICPRCAAK